MSTTPQPPAGGTAATTVKDRLERLQRELADERARTQRSSILTLIVGVLALLLLGGYFAYGYSEIKKLANSDDLIGFAEIEIERRLPEGRRLLEKQLVDNAPEWADRLSKQALENMPTAREKCEEYALEQYEVSMKEVANLTDEQFRTYLRANRPMIEKHFKELGDKPTLAESSVEELQKSLEDQLQTNMKSSAKDLLDTLLAANAKLKRLQANKDLTKEEENERRVIMLARRIQLENLDPNALGKSEIPTAKQGTKPPDKRGTLPKPGTPGDAAKDKSPAPKPASPPETIEKGKEKVKAASKQ
jgi:hypothetical protein